jgi:hypothetical protein
MRARSFFYACAGVLMLAIAYTIGARHAEATFVDHTSPIVIAFAQPYGGGEIALRSDGTVWELRNDPDGNPSWENRPHGLPPVNLEDIAFWGRHSVITASGEGWLFRGFGCDGQSGLGISRSNPTPDRLSRGHGLE